MKALSARALAAALLRRARREGGLVAVFDLDGTLAPIAPTPGAARVPPRARRALLRLARAPGVTVGVVSGRPLAQVEARVGRGRLHVAGLHGLARRAPGGRPRRGWSARQEESARRLAARLRRRFGAVHGFRLERKGPLVAAHLRGVPPPARREVAASLLALRPRGFAALAGRQVVEFRPPRAGDKSGAVRWIRRARPGVPVLYAGDDTTDEDAFAALGPRDFPVLVGSASAARERPGPPRGTLARFRLSGPGAVADLLETLAAGLAAPPEKTT